MKLLTAKGYHMNCRHLILLALAAFTLNGCGGSSSSSAPITAHTAVTYRVTPLFTNTTTISGIHVSAVLPVGVFPILSSPSTRVLKTGVTSLLGQNGARILSQGRYSSTTREVVFDAVASNLTAGFSGDFARLTYTTAQGVSPVKSDFGSFTYLVSGPGGSVLSTRVATDVNLTPY